MVKIEHFSKLMKLNIHLLLCSKRHYIDEIEYPSSPICGEKPQFESNVTSFQFRQNALFFSKLHLRRHFVQITFEIIKKLFHYVSYSYHLYPRKEIICVVLKLSLL